MVLRILGELGILSLIILGSIWFWQFPKRGAFLHMTMRNETFLQGFLTAELLDHPHAAAEIYARPNEAGHFLNLAVLIQADRRSQRLPFLLLATFLLICFVLSYFLGVRYLILNLVLFLLIRLLPAEDSVRNNALSHIVEIGVILRRWHRENPGECDNFVRETKTLIPIYSVIKQLS
jgi:hypothetical protein